MKLLFWKKKAQKERKSRVKNGKLKLLRGLYMISKTDPCKARTEYWMNEFNVSSRTIERWFFQLEQGGYLLRDRRIKNKRVPILKEKGLEMAVEVLKMAVLYLLYLLILLIVRSSRRRALSRRQKKLPSRRDPQESFKSTSITTSGRLYEP